jgi:hypothetical protein
MRYPVILLLLAISLGAPGNPPGGLNKVSTIYVTGDMFTTDNLGYVYIVKKDELRKYNPADNSFESYSTKNSGNISFVDASNSLKLLLYYTDFTQVIFLDNRLGITGSPILFQDINLQQTSLVCSSHSNGIVLYNARDFELIRLDEKLETTFKTGNLAQVLQQAVDPNYLQQAGNFIYLNNPASGLLVFDIYGAYVKNIPVKGLSSFQVSGEQLYYLQNGKLMSYHLKTLITSEIPLPEADVKGFRVEKNKLYLQTGSAVVTYVTE